MDKSKIAVFPGSFDPFTKGHEDIIQRALPLFDKIYIIIGINSAKHNLFPVEKRLAWIHSLYDHNSKIEIGSYDGLTVNFCHSVNAGFIIRGIRNTLDFQMEKDIAEANKRLNPTIETIFLATASKYAHLSSSVVRDLFIHNGDYSEYVSVTLT